MPTSPYYDNDVVQANTFADRRAHQPQHRRPTTLKQGIRWMSDLPTDPVPRAADMYQGTGTLRLPGKHRAGRHEGEREVPEFRYIPHNVCTGLRCAGRLRFAPHRYWNSPQHGYHR